MKALFFDAGPIISLVMSRMVSILPELKKKFGGQFYITPAVRKELIERPLTVKRFGFEALQVLKLVREGVLEIYDKVPQQKVNNLIQMANQSFSIKGKTMDIIQAGEMESVACALDLGTNNIVMDERTLRLFIENNKEMRKLLEHRFRKPVTSNVPLMTEFSKSLQKIKIIRSIELVGVAYKQGLFDSYIPKQRGGRDLLLESILWTTKFNGCAVTPHEIEELKSYLT